MGGEAQEWEDGEACPKATFLPAGCKMERVELPWNRMGIGQKAGSAGADMLEYANWVEWNTR